MLVLLEQIKFYFLFYSGSIIKLLIFARLGRNYVFLYGKNTQLLSDK